MDQIKGQPALQPAFKPACGEQALDEALEESFPASDPVAIDTGPPVRIDAPVGPRKDGRLSAPAAR